MNTETASSRSTTPMTSSRRRVIKRKTFWGRWASTTKMTINTAMWTVTMFGSTKKKIGRSSLISKTWPAEMKVIFITENKRSAARSFTMPTTTTVSRDYWTRWRTEHTLKSTFASTNRTYLPVSKNTCSVRSQFRTVVVRPPKRSRRRGKILPKKKI